MAIYEISSSEIRSLEPTTFPAVKLRERDDLQRLLRDNIAVICPDTLVISEEFSEWDEANRRIDLLGVDKRGNIVVIELKRTETGGHMELQALRYAAMVSTLTFDRVIDVFRRYLESRNIEGDPEALLREFLDLEGDDAIEDQFAQDVRIVLASAEFSKELTTCVLWLNERGLDITCVRLRPYLDGERVLLDVQQAIPLPESEQYQVKLREKTQKQRASRKSGRDYTKYDVTVNGTVYPRLNKAHAAYHVVQGVIEGGASPVEIIQAVSFRKTNCFRIVDGEGLCEDEFIARASADAKAEGKTFDDWRFFTDADKLFSHGGKSYAVSKQWGGRCERWMGEVIAAFPDKGVSFSRAET